MARFTPEAFDRAGSFVLPRRTLLRALGGGLVASASAIAPTSAIFLQGEQRVDAALYSGSKCYFFSGDQYVRVTRGETGPGTVDPGYPEPISNWGWGDFGANGIDAALFSGSKCYFFAGNEYIRVTRGDIGPGTLDPNYPQPIDNWGWPEGF